MSKVRLLVASVLFLVPGCMQQQQEPPFKPVATVQEIMESLVAHMAEDVFASVQTIISEKGVEEIAPKNDEEWQEVQFAAMGLAETGNLLMFESRARDKEEWIQLSQQLIDKSISAAKAAEAKNAEQLFDAGGQLYEVCRNCHMKYVPQDPPLTKTTP